MLFLRSFGRRYVKEVILIYNAIMYLKILILLSPPDLDQSGLLPISSLFESIDFMRNMYTDCFLDLLDIDYTDGEINFSEFLDIVMTYCMFERNEIFKCKEHSILDHI